MKRTHNVIIGKISCGRREFILFDGVGRSSLTFGISWDIIGLVRL